MVRGRVASPDPFSLDRLAAEHAALEARLAELGRHIGLTAAEKDEYRRIKLRKVATRDRIRALTGA